MQLVNCWKIPLRGDSEMIKKVSLSVLLFLALVNFSQARTGGNFGLGIILGEPTGISGKLWMSGTSAIDGAVAWSWSDNTSFHLHMDYLIHNFSVIKVESGQLPLYFGIGGRIKFREGDRDDVFGVRIPVGLDYLFTNQPLDIFFEIVPMLDLAPDTDFDMAGGVGIRFYF
jgi:hypothetical protein